jgi:DNA-binding transcriptional MerR regulator
MNRSEKSASKAYRIQEFAELTGVTVRALHYYDRLGLLKPRRTAAGYRLYSGADAQRLEQIVALKFLGLPLKQVKLLLDRDGIEFAEALLQQRRVLEEKRLRLDRAISAIASVEKTMASGEPVAPSALKTIIEAIEMQDGLESMKEFYGEEAWIKLTREPDRSERLREWLELCNEVTAMLGRNPASEEVQLLVARWDQLCERATGGDPGIRASVTKAWGAREKWPANVRQRVAAINLEKVTEFITKAAACWSRRYYSDDAWSKLMNRPLQSNAGNTGDWVDLYRDIAAALGEGPESVRGQELAARWNRLSAASSDGDAEISEGAARAWADRKNWPEWVRRAAATRYQLDFRTCEDAVEFINRALALPRP